MAIRYFALVLGFIFTIVGLAGFVPSFLVPVGGEPSLMIEHNYGYLFGLFPVNTVHNLVHLAIGIWGLFAYKRLDTARTYARGLSIIYGVLTVLGLFPVTNTLFGLAPLFAHDIWLHAVTALASAYMGFVYERTQKPNSPPTNRPVYHA